MSCILFILRFNISIPLSVFNINDVPKILSLQQSKRFRITIFDKNCGDFNSNSIYAFLSSLVCGN